ncbi:MAG: PmoA family protein [Prevotellaceae bacterium]|jgi:hypothetical protein|nr:PmoA family protein [Prevotellaceae bacterium]
MKKSQCNYLIVLMYFMATVSGQGFAKNVRQDNSLFQWDIKSNNQFALKHNNKIVWQFNADSSDASKPYFDPLCVVGGQSLTLPKPADHIWHLGHWFSWKYINGVNYWETDQNGIAQGETFWSTPKRELNSDGSAQISLELGYRPRKEENVPALVKEHREIVISAPDSDGAYSLDWIQQFTAMEDVIFDRTPIIGEKDGVHFGGYAGLSVRFSNELKEVKTVTTDSTNLRKYNNNYIHIYDVAAVEQNGVIDGQEYGIAILSHPDSQYGRNWYIIEEQNFTYISPAILLQGAVKLSRGETLTLYHRVHVHKDRWDAVKLNKAVSDFLETKNKQLISQ